MIKKSCTDVLCLLAILMSCNSYADITPYPLHNGDFSICQANGLPTHWAAAPNDGNPKFLVRIPNNAPGKIKNPSSIAVIDNNLPGTGTYYQDVELIKGRYTFSVEVNAPSSTSVIISIADKNVEAQGKNRWEKNCVDFNSSDMTTRAAIIASGTGIAEFRNAQITIKQLHTGTVPMSDGGVLGALVLPSIPSEAEKFAAFELQNYIHKMTGITPGLAGRDHTFKGRSILIGTAAVGLLRPLNNLEPDAYMVGQDGNSLVLAGVSPRATLYAAYDYLKLQGCGWFMPGGFGEVVPARKRLEIIKGIRIESPIYNVRGYMLLPYKQYHIDGGWSVPNFDEYADWCVRNRINAFLVEYGRTSDLGAHRGYGYDQLVNHSWARVCWDPNHPEYYALVNGVRTQMHPSGRPNSICISNPELRNSLTQNILQFFKENPKCAAFALSADDDPHYWCECPACRVLDSDHGKGKWVTDKAGYPELDMADRALNFVNDIADRVAKVYPDKYIEMYAYAATRNPPKREKVHPNVLIKFTYWPGGPLNKSLLDTGNERNTEVNAQLDGWKQAEARYFGLYDYGEFFHPEAPVFWFYHVADSLKTFNEKWGFRHCLGENDNSFVPSLMYYNIRATAMWNPNLHWKEEVQNNCVKFYGKAAPKMTEYYMFMANCVMKADTWKQKDYSWLLLAEYEIPQMTEGRMILESALDAAGDDKVLVRRINLARFGHAYMTICVAQKNQSSSDQTVKEATDAFNLANTLCRQYNITLQQGSLAMLKSLYFPPSVGKPLYKLPLNWQFMRDPNDEGVTKQWFKFDNYNSWQPISVDKDWTSQGHQYHGVAWYAVKFQMGVEESKQKEFFENSGKLALFFGAVDGTADIFLDGKQIGEQKRDAGYMWDKSFTIALPKNFDSTTSHTVVVRVSKDMAAAGIWKPVTLVSQD